MIIKEKPFNDWQLPDTDPNKVVVAFDSEYQSGTRNHISIGGDDNGGDVIFNVIMPEKRDKKDEEGIL